MDGCYKAKGLKKGLATMANKRVGKSKKPVAKFNVPDSKNKKIAMDSGY